MATHDISAKLAELIAGGWTYDEINERISTALGYQTVQRYVNDWSGTISSRRAESVLRSLPTVRAEVGMPSPTAAQMAYIADLGGDMAKARTMTVREASAYIDGLKVSRPARAAGARLGIAAKAASACRCTSSYGEIWDRA